MTSVSPRRPGGPPGREKNGGSPRGEPQKQCTQTGTVGRIERSTTVDFAQELLVTGVHLERQQLAQLIFH